MSKESTHALMGSVVYAPGVLVSIGPSVRKGKTKRDHGSGAHARTISNRGSCKFRSDSTNCNDCPAHAPKGR